MPKCSLHRRFKHGDIRRHSSVIKLHLSEEDKKARQQFCISMIEGSSIPRDPIFKNMFNIVLIDEKWFYMTKKSQCYYLLSDEDEPLRTCKSKNFIAKVMFLVALARPRFDNEGKELFSGKIGLWAFVKREPAKRASANRPAGIMETKALTSVNRDISRSYFIEKVIPSIKAKWLREDIGSPIFIQQDNARTHICLDDEEFRQVATQDGFDIRLMCQPPNSPDLNILDLGFFRAIQSLQHKEAPKTIDELIDAVVNVYESFLSIRSNHIFLTLQSCMVEIMKEKGSKKYQTPHMKKEMLEKEGQLPIQLKCDPDLVEETLRYLGSV
ncbi:uncharacterized protein LOC132066441 [Lycium ferocissimum]|uniref:uncharacterized protein LOC132066441 n=1 Tax=Lycium ferocissimum TaxID=112874 RepID=UPI0028169494|nr:uncharacterized protein LOC132066441 [Lycium ferocissimum]